MTRAYLYSFLTLLLCSPVLLAQQAKPQKPTFEVYAIKEEIHIDGELRENAWQKPPTFTLDYETSPGDNVPAKVRTEVWISYDESTFYVAVRAHDPAPEQIRAHLTDRDRAFQDDFVGVVLDTFNDERRAFEFFSNPLGVQMDMSLSDVTGKEDESWDAIWDSSGRITDKGYEVEMAIPFSSLRFPYSADPGTWGIDAVRRYPRDQNYRLALNARPRGSSCYLCWESKLSGFAGAKPGRNLELTPTLTGNQSSERIDPAADFSSDNNMEGGLSVRWGITPGINLNGAINPDFSQVEADAAQLDVNTQFAIFYPEKRPFFLEGADLFDTKINAIYTRDIADPSWGAKISGKENSNAFGGIVARDEATNFIFPGNQGAALGSIDAPNTSSIFRYRHDLGSGSTLGTLFTSREGKDYYNRVVGFDSLLRSDTNAFRIEMLGSATEYPRQVQDDFGQPSGSLYSTATRAVYQHTTVKWMGLLQYLAAGDDFRADLGFIPQVGFHKGYGIGEYYLYSDEGRHWWRKLTFGTESTWTYDREGNPLQQQVAPYLLVEAPHEFFGNFYIALGPSYLYGKRFDRNFVNAYMEMGPTGSFSWHFETRVGQEIDYENVQQGDIVRLTPGVRFDLGRRLRLQVDQNFEKLDVQGGKLYTANVSDVRVTYQINNRTFVRLVSQYFNVSRNPELYSFEVNGKDQLLFNQFLFSYKINPQTVLFLGYSDNYENAPGYSLTQGNRTLFFKVGYAFVL